MSAPIGARGTLPWPPLPFSIGVGPKAVTLDAGEHSQTTQDFGYGTFTLYRIEDDGDKSGSVRIRGYIDTDYQAADVDRDVGVDPEGDHGVLYDVVLDGNEFDTAFELNLSPLVACRQHNASATHPVTITNLSADNAVDYAINWSILPSSPED